MGKSSKLKTKKRKLNRLEPITLKKLKSGMHSDGGGLYLLVQESGSRSWILRTMVRGRRRDIGLGGVSTRTLAEARSDAAELRAKARKGEDILAKRRLEKHKSNTPTFEETGSPRYLFFHVWKLQKREASQSAPNTFCLG